MSSKLDFGSWVRSLCFIPFSVSRFILSTFGLASGILQLVAEFARAGLQNPVIVRLNTEETLSDKLNVDFFTLRSEEKISSLVYLLRDVLKIPTIDLATEARIRRELDSKTSARKAELRIQRKRGKKTDLSNARPSYQNGKKRSFTYSSEQEGDGESFVADADADDDDDDDDLDIVAEEDALIQTAASRDNSSTTPLTVVFVCTKHHCEYLAELLRQGFSFPVVFVHGSMDQSARRINLARFRSGLASVLIVTDLAARGLGSFDAFLPLLLLLLLFFCCSLCVFQSFDILPFIFSVFILSIGFHSYSDIPDVKTVINFDFPSKPKVFVHRVGRAARAGRSGRSFSLISHDEVSF